MLKITCPNCNTQFDDDRLSIEDCSAFPCPNCEAMITITMTWELPEPKQNT